MKAIFLLNGPPAHGIVRASRILADALLAEGGCAVATVATADSSPSPATLAELRRLAEPGDVVVLHFSSRTNDLWGPPETRAATLAAAVRGMAARPVLYLHDIYGETRWGQLGDLVRWSLLGRRKAIRRLVRLLTTPADPSAEAGALAGFDRWAAGFLVSNEVERDRLLAHRLRAPVAVQPHFIETRPDLPAPGPAKAALGLAGAPVFTVLGFIVPRKGHDLAIDMLAARDGPGTLVFAGAVPDGAEGYGAELRARAAARGVADRLRWTGYLGEADLDRVLAATDVAVCPFSDVAASGSLATWLATDLPVVATDLPLLRRYQAEFGQSILLPRQRDAAHFARALDAALALPAAARADRGRIAARYSPAASARTLAATLARMAGPPPRD